MIRIPSRCTLTLGALLWVGSLAGCATDFGPEEHPVGSVEQRGAGAECESDANCESGFCNTEMPGGLCTASDCSECADGTTCAASHLGEACFQTCSMHRDCRAGYQCLGGACLPGCSADADCGRNSFCSKGYCEKRPPIVTGN